MELWSLLSSRLWLRSWYSGLRRVNRDLNELILLSYEWSASVSYRQAIWPGARSTISILDQVIHLTPPAGRLSVREPIHCSLTVARIYPTAHGVRRGNPYWMYPLKEASPANACFSDKITHWRMFLLHLIAKSLKLIRTTRLSNIFNNARSTVYRTV